MVAAIVLGILIALIGFIPYAFVMRKSRKMVTSDVMGNLKWFLLTFVISFVVLVVALIVCAKVAHDVALPFAAAEILTFIVVTIVVGLTSRGAKN